MTSTSEVYAGKGFGYDPTLEAAEYGIAVQLDPTAPDGGRYDDATRTIYVRPHRGRAAYRSSVAVQLAYAVIDYANAADVVEFAVSRLIDHSDLVALARVTPDRGLWARVLDVRLPLLEAYMQVRSGLPVTP